MLKFPNTELSVDQDRLPLPSVDNIVLLEPPVILTLLAGPKLLTPLTTMFPVLKVFVLALKAKLLVFTFAV